MVDLGLLLIPCPLYCLCLVLHPNAQRGCFLIDPVSQAPRTQYSLSPWEPASTEPNPHKQKLPLVLVRAMNTGPGARNVTHTVPLKPPRHRGPHPRTLKLREGKRVAPRHTASKCHCPESTGLQGPYSKSGLLKLF